MTENYDPHPHNEHEFPPRIVADATPKHKAKSKEDYAGYNPVFLNRFQRLVYSTCGRYTACASGRATGKTTLLGLHTIRVAQSIPRGSGLFGGPSLKNIYTKTQPALIKSMEQVCGLYEGRHYFRGQPPTKLRASWPRPLAMPRTFDNVLYFYTGHITYFVSVLSVAAGNGFNLTDITIDECRLIKWKYYLESILPSLRGDIYDNPGWNKDKNFLYLSQFLMSDNGVIQSQREWYNDFKKMVTPETNRQIAEMIAELRVYPELQQLPKFMEKLNRLRANATTLYTCASAYNEALPQNFLRDMKMQLPGVIFDVQIMGKDIDEGVDNEQYYYCFNPDVHLYEQNEWDATCAILGNANRVHKTKDGYGGSIEWEAPDLNITSRHANDSWYDVDIDPKFPLCLAWDLNANFNAVLISQRIPHGARMEIRVVNCLYTKYKDKLRALLAKFMAYYAHHKSVNKHLVITIDDTMKQGASYALEDTDTRYINVIQDVLTRSGWELQIEQIGRPMLHEVKFQFINDVLAGLKPYDVRINKELDFLIAAIGKTKVKQTSRGPMKDKSKEKLKSESENSLGQQLEERTDITDAFDNAIVGAVKSVAGYAPKGTAGVIFCPPTTLH